MGNPSNPTDGQTIVVQITQGSDGSFTITWGSSYGFSSGLPSPRSVPEPARLTCSGSSTTRP